MVYVRLEKDWTDGTGVTHPAGDTVDVDAATVGRLQKDGIVSGGTVGWAGPTGPDNDPAWAGPTRPENPAWAGPTRPENPAWAGPTIGEEAGAGPTGPGSNQPTRYAEGGTPVLGEEDI